MTVKKLVFVLLFSFCLCAACFSATLESVCAELAKRPYTTGTFTQTKTLAQNKRSLKSSGTFIFGAEGIMWNTLKPFPSTMTITKQVIVQTAADGTRSEISAADDPTFGSVANTLTAVFANDLSLLKENFNIDFTSLPDGTWSLMLIPKDASVKKMLQSLLVEGTAAGDGGSASSGSAGTAIQSITMVEESGNTVRYVFADQVYLLELPADENPFKQSR